MTRKGRQAAERALRANGAMTIEWDHGQKHEIATCRLGSGHILDIAFSRGARDEVRVRRFVENRIKEHMRDNPLPPTGR